MISISVMSGAVMSAISDHPRNAEQLTQLVDKSDKNCNTHNCAMWNKRSKQCGLIK
jgi:hypothetical protein